VSALRDISLRVGPSEAVAITGRSGKSTLLALIGGGVRARQAAESSSIACGRCAALTGQT
jgi:ABC-type lipoprotein export system ATPase subunit